MDDIFGGEGQDAFEFMYISIRYWARNALLLRMIVRAGLHVRMCRHKTSDLDLHLRMNVVAPSLFQIGVLFPQQPSRHFPIVHVFPDLWRLHSKPPIRITRDRG